MTFNQVVRGSSPRCLIKKRLSIERRFFNVRHGRARTTDNAVGRGSRGPVDLGFERTEAERRGSPRCPIKNVSQLRDVFLMLDMGGHEPRTGAERRHEVRWTSALSGPKRSGERVPDVSYLGKILILSCPN